MELVIGIDIGGTKTKIGLVNKDGHCLETAFFRTREYPDLEKYLDKVVETVEELKSKFPGELNILGCGVGAPNASSKYGTIVKASNLIWKWQEMQMPRKCTGRLWIKPLKTSGGLLKNTGTELRAIGLPNGMMHSTSLSLS